MVYSPAKGAKHALTLSVHRRWCSKYDRCLQAGIKSVLTDGWICGGLLPESLVVVKLSLASVSLCHLDEESGIGQLIPCPRVGGPDCHIAKKAIIPRRSVVTSRSLGLVAPNRCMGCVPGTDSSWLMSAKLSASNSFISTKLPDLILCTSL